MAVNFYRMLDGHFNEFLFTVGGYCDRAFALGRHFPAINIFSSHGYLLNVEKHKILRAQLWRYHWCERLFSLPGGDSAASGCQADPAPLAADLSGPLGVVTGTKPVDHHHRLLADDPGVVAFRERGDISGTRDELRAIVHPDGEFAGDVVLEMRGFAARGLGERLDVIGPAPAWLKYQATDLRAADGEN